jgi:hypothetical protein
MGCGPTRTSEMAEGLPVTPLRRAGEAGRETGIARANARALALAPIIAEIQADGVTRPHAIAAALTDRGVPTAQGHRFWISKQVRQVMDRLARLAPSSSPRPRIPTSPHPKRGAKPLIDISGTILSNTARKPFATSKAQRRGRPTHVRSWAKS